MCILEKCPKTEARDLTSSQTDVSLKYTNLLQSSEDIFFEEILLRLEAKKILWKEWNILSNECTSNEESFPIHTAQRKIVFNVLYNNSTKGRLCNDTNFSNYTWLFGSLLVVVDVDAVGNVCPFAACGAAFENTWTFKVFCVCQLQETWTCSFHFNKVSPPPSISDEPKSEF